MARTWLRDDVETVAWAGRPTQFDPVTVALDDDGCTPCGQTGAVVPGGIPVDPAPDPEVPQSELFPVLTVRLRTRTGYDDDGVPEFDWTTRVETRAIFWQQREEFDAEAGFTLVKATATILYEGEQKVPETAGVWTDDTDDGTQWRVVASRMAPGRLEFDLERIEG